MKVLKYMLLFVNLAVVMDLIFFRRKETESTWAWILLLLNFPILGIALYLLAGQTIPKYRTRGNAENIGNITEDNHVEILISGEEKFQAVFTDIINAKNEILIQYYIFKDDLVFEKLRELLYKKASEGIKIKLLYDGLGSRKIKRKIWNEMRRKGIEVKKFKHNLFSGIGAAWMGFNYRNHRKILVVDQYVGYIGGYNIGREYLGLELKFGHWRDTHFRIQGSAVNSLRNIFLEDWGEEGVAVYRGGSRGSTVQMVASAPTSASPYIRNVYLRCIGNSRERIWIQTPYFIPDAATLNALKLALLSGKEVKLMIPKKPDHMFVYWATLYYAADLLQMGAKIYIYEKGFLHAKGIIMDEEVYCYGTANMDIRSFHLNYEMNVIVYGKEEVEEMCRIFEQDIKDCKELTWQEYNSRRLKIRIKEQISRLLSPLL